MMDEDDEMERLRRWLPGQDPRTWHQVALTWNWDNGTELLDWILDQPQCDRGTAIAIYLAGEPDFYADEFASLDEIRAANHFGLEVAQFLARICERWAEGRFPDYELHPGFWLDRTKLWDEITPGMIS